MSDSQRTRGLRGAGPLIAINAALLMGLAFVTLSPFAGAQGFRPATKYHMVAGTAPGLPSAVVYIVDETNEQLVAVGMDPSTRQLGGVGYADLAADRGRAGRNRN